MICMCRIYHGDANIQKKTAGNPEKLGEGEKKQGERIIMMVRYSSLKSRIPRMNRTENTKTDT